MVGEISRKCIHDVGIHGGMRMVADGLRWVCMSVMGRIGRGEHIYEVCGGTEGLTRPRIDTHITCDLCGVCMVAGWEWREKRGWRRDFQAPITGHWFTPTDQYNISRELGGESRKNRTHIAPKT